MNTTTTVHSEQPQPQPPKPKPRVQPELIRGQTAAALLGVSKVTLYEWQRLGYLPNPVRIENKNIGWRRRELIAWVVASCPHRNDWRWVDAELPTVQQFVRQAKNELAQAVERTNEQRREADAVRREIQSLDQAKSSLQETVRQLDAAAGRRR